MKTITDSVRHILHNDEVAREAARRGILNASAYAREIAAQVADQTWKEVDPTTISVSVTRVQQENMYEPMKPPLVFDKVSVETGLVDVTFERSQEVRSLLQRVVPALREQYPHDLYIETHGQHQITIVLTEQLWSELQMCMETSPVVVYTNQAALTLVFNKSYLEVPNFIYAVLGTFALDAINIFEIFSTLTELVVVIHHDDLDRALARTKQFLK